MKKIIYKIGIISIILLIVMSMITPIFANGPNFSDEGYWNRLCTTQYNDNKSACESYRSHRLDQIKKNQDKVSDLKNQQSSLQKDIDKVVAEVEESDKRISEIEKEIKSIDEEIRYTHIRIGQIESQITNRLVEIDLQEHEVADIMVLTQSTYRTNDYLEFIMGSQDFSEMMRRMAGVNSFKRSMDTTIELLVESKLELESDKLKIEDEKENLVQSRNISDIARQDAEVIKESQKVLQRALNAKQSELMNSVAEMMVKNNADQKIIDNIKPVIASNGFTRPVSSDFRISHGVWTYADGDGYHMGIDIARSRISGNSIMGRPIVAAGNGIVASAKDNGCANGGYKECGGGFGNFVTIIINVKGSIYGVLYAHMTPGTIGVRANQEISAGQFLGSVGDSGNSFGAHAHVEVFYLGDDSVQAAWNRWSGGTTFDTARGVDGGSKCDNNGYSYPCRVNPLNIFGFRVGGEY